MKKICVILSIILCIVSFSGCSNTSNVKNTGNVKNAEIVTIESEIFTEKEILDAIDVVKAEFVGFTGCTLTKIGYVGDQETYKTVCTEDALVNPPWITLDCEFTTSSSSFSEGFNNNETYAYGLWKWYLIKDDSGNWIIDNYGVA